MTEQLYFHVSVSCIGEGNGNPLQCSCLENPRDGGAWWAAVYGVTQSRTRLKWLSSTSMTNPQLTYSVVKKQKAFPLNSRTRQGCPLSPFLLNIVSEVLITAIRQEKKKQRYSNWRKEIKLWLFASNMILYI